ncbi:MAG: helix-turn-helix transcriptional regulator [Treponema sp.]|jgi:transcriptional regulator with XRE-family HTH domain|nr:helix-turn-helix transcriptional regulator [Treponema sp.]
MMGKKTTHREGHWIKYQMALKDITQADIASRVGCTVSMVSRVIHGRKASAKVSMALVKALGYQSFEEMIATCGKGGVA